MQITGKYCTADVYADIIEDEAIAQIKQMLDTPFTEGSHIAIMPDVHSGKGCTIGTTMTVHAKVVPNLVGVDIGCGVTFCEIDERGEIGNAELEELDKIIYAYIPSGFDVRDTLWRKDHPGSRLGPDFWGLNGFEESDLRSLKCADKVSVERAIASVGSLGGGNHYIECDRASDGRIWLAVHSGSRSLGTGAAEYYQKLAIRQRRNNLDFREEVQKLKEMYKETPSLIGDKVSELMALRKSAVSDELCWLDKADGSGFDDYMHDMALIQKYAALNRLAMIREISEKMGWRLGRKIETIHNYIDTENMILRKGAVSAAQDELLVIPMNMRDGILVCKGKGNPAWNCSAPHGAGRIMSRRAAREKLKMDEFKESMRGIYTTSVNTETIDECPMAYKPAESIKQAIADTVEIVDSAKPLYNFKAAERGTYRKRG